MFRGEATVIEEKVYDIIRSPLSTEKSTIATQNNWYAFKVSVDASKPQIKKAVQKLFNVTVETVNTLNVKGKVKKFKGILGKRKGFKKALVKLKAGDTIDTTGEIK